ncbi:MAG: acyl-CoA thioesterase [Bacteroidota bacterium]|nr:acyl-CoA thioesterase [Bacteroidota bacterium]
MSQANITTLTLRIDWSELDLFGHVNNVAFMKYVQAARVNYWEQIGLYKYYTERKHGPMLASTYCEFKKPLFYPGDIMIHSQMEFIKNSSFGIVHQIYNSHEELAAEAKDVMVMYDFISLIKMPFPEDIKKLVSI